LFDVKFYINIKYIIFFKIKLKRQVFLNAIVCRWCEKCNWWDLWKKA